MKPALDGPALIALVERYFSAVDRMDLAATLACFEPDASFRIASFETTYQGRDHSIRAMFERLNQRYARIWHGGFEHVVQAPGRVASQFRVENTLHDGRVSIKYNCNFFRFRGECFDAVQVYMSGDNSLG